MSLISTAVIAHTGHQTIVRFQWTWPWTIDIVIAFQRPRIAPPQLTSRFLEYRTGSEPTTPSASTELAWRA
ncbi:MAG: hypothetical protein H0U21_09810 [Acidimicrobiia bacterium]|nr:hypothetical protein [Acidimicrobiia bacterium]